MMGVPSLIELFDESNYVQLPVGSSNSQLFRDHLHHYMFSPSGAPRPRSCQSVSTVEISRPLGPSTNT